MKRSKRIIALLCSTLLVAGLFAGCGGSKDKDAKKPANTQEEAPKGGKELVVWSHLTDPEVAALKPVADAWAKKTGNTVKVQADKGDFQAFLQAANSSKGPDVMFGVPHDNLGTYKKAGLLAEVTDLDKSKYPENAVKAVSYGDKAYAIPVAVESIALFYNTDKVKEAPKTVDDLIADAKKVGFKYDINNMYCSFPFYASDGGYIFKDNNGTLDPNDLGFNKPEGIKGWQLIQDMTQKYKFMTPDIKGDIAMGEFQNGKTGLYISGPWDVEGLKKANVKFAVAPMPTMNGKPLPTFVGVQAGFVTARSKNQTEAMDLLKYLAENAEEPVLLNVGHRIPALNSVADKVKKSDPITAAFIEQVDNGIPMPNIPEVISMWKINDSLNLLTSGKVSAKDYGAKAENDVKSAIAQQK